MSEVAELPAQAETMRLSENTWAWQESHDQSDRSTVLLPEPLEPTSTVRPGEKTRRPDPCTRTAWL